MRERPTENSRAPSSPELFLDFDYTLFRSNSTEQFIAFCKPSFVISLIDFIMRGLIPWKLLRDTNRCRIKDWACCVAILIVTPWNYFLWRRAAPGIFERLRNHSLETEISEVGHEDIVIITFGMRAIVGPLLRGSVWNDVRLIATPFIPSPFWFYRGKYPILQKSFEDDLISGASCITDSEDDRDMIDRTKGRLIDRQGPLYSARSALYVPFRYMAIGKYTRSYAVDQIIFVDIALALIAVSMNLRDLLVNAAFVPLFMLSVISIYEIGYFENDMKAAKREARPTVKDNVSAFADYPIEPGAWIWAGILAALGLLIAWKLAVFSDAAAIRIAILWPIALVAIRIIFHFYNKSAVQFRSYLYPLLQFSKFAWALFLIPLTSPGVVLVLAHVAAMWSIYLIYRMGGNQRNISRETIRAILGAVGFALLVPMVVAGKPVAFGIVAGSIWLLSRVAKERAMMALKKR